MPALQTNLMIRDFREERFLAKLPAEKQRFMEGYIELVWVLKKRGDEAVAALADYAERQSIDLTKAERKGAHDHRARRSSKPEKR